MSGYTTIATFEVTCRGRTNVDNVGPGATRTLGRAGLCVVVEPPTPQALLSFISDGDVHLVLSWHVLRGEG